jgi:hypothetical protein
MNFSGLGRAQVLAFGFGLLWAFKIKKWARGFLNLGPYNRPEKLLKFIKFYYTKNISGPRAEFGLGLCVLLSIKFGPDTPLCTGHPAPGIK